MRTEVPLGRYRALVLLLTLASVGLLALAIFFLVPPSRPVAAALAGATGVGLFLATLRFGIEADATAARRIVYVTKRECSLCHEQRARLETLTDARGLELVEAMIDHDARLRKQYRDWVPVVLWQGHEVAKGRFDWPEVEARLDAIQARS